MQRFYADLWRRLLHFQLGAPVLVPLRLLADYSLGFGSQLWVLRILLEAQLCWSKDSHDSVNAALAAEFYGADYLAQITQIPETANGLRQALTRAFGPLLTSQGGVWQHPVLLPAGLSVQVAIPLPTGPLPQLPAGERPDFGATRSAPAPTASPAVQQLDKQRRPQLQARLAAMRTAAAAPRTSVLDPTP